MMQKPIHSTPVSGTQQDFISHAARLARQIRPSVLAQMLYAGRSTELAQALADQTTTQADARLLIAQASAFTLSGEYRHNIDALVTRIACEQMKAA